MKNIAPLLLLALASCAHFQTSQTDTTTTKDGVTASRTTKASATTFLDAKSDLAKFHASQTDKTQSASVGALGQESSGTNVVNGISALATLVKELKTP